MWVMDILYAVAGLCVCETPDSNVDSYRDLRGGKNYAHVKLPIPFNLAVMGFQRSYFIQHFIIVSH